MINRLILFLIGLMFVCQVQCAYAERNNPNQTPLQEIEELLKLGDTHFYELNDKTTALKYVNQAIKLTKKNYGQGEIEKLVNGTNVELIELELSGDSNPIRDLYILKSDIEECVPELETQSHIKDLELIEYRIYNIRYRTDW